MTITCQPLEIIHNLINDNTFVSTTEAIKNYFEKEILTEEAVRLIPGLESSPKNYSLVKLDEVLVIQDCIEDEFYQSTIKGPDGVRINSGLWTRSIYEPEGISSANCVSEMNFNELQVRKRLLAVCKKTGKPFVLAIYRIEGNDEGWEKWRQDTFKMNSMHEVIGIYEEDAFEDNDDTKCSESTNSDSDTCALPTIHLIKRIDHVIPTITIETEADVKAINNKLISYLTECFGEDSKALVDALILLLVSKPSRRVDGLIDSLFIGKLSLNLILKDTNAESVDNLKKIINELKHFSANIKIDEGNFSLSGIYPRLDVKTGQILPGAVLQQPDGCVLLIEETELKEGQVFKDQAVQNLQSLIDLIRQQVVNYDFGVQQITLKTDMPVVTVSRGKKSVLPFDLCVECASVKFIESSDFTTFKAYLEYARNLNFTVNEEMATHLELDYLNLRKSSPLLPNGNPKMNEQEFHRLMNLARLKAVSVGERELSLGTWESTKSMYL